MVANQSALKGRKKYNVVCPVIQQISDPCFRVTVISANIGDPQ